MAEEAISWHYRCRADEAENERGPSLYGPGPYRCLATSVGGEGGI